MNLAYIPDIIGRFPPWADALVATRPTIPPARRLHALSINIPTPPCEEAPHVDP